MIIRYQLRAATDIKARHYSLFVMTLGIISLFSHLTEAQSRRACVTQHPTIQVEELTRHIDYLTSDELAGRRGTTAIQAAKYIASEFESYGLKPLFPKLSYLQSVPGVADNDGSSSIAGCNVGAILPACRCGDQNSYLIIAAHHDHLGQTAAGIYRGADDNASAVASLIEIARTLRSIPHRKHRVIFLSFDLEERLLFGSRWFLAHPPVPIHQMKLLIVSDMLGRSLGDLPLNSLFVFGAESGVGLRQSLNRSGIPLGLSLEFLSERVVGTRSDYGPFRDRNIPYLFFSTGQSRDYHTIRDTPDRLNLIQIQSISEFYFRLMKTLLSDVSLPSWSRSPDQTQEDLLLEVQTILKIVTQIESHMDQWNLKPLQRLFVTQARTQAEKILKMGVVQENDRAWLMRTTQLLLFSVF